MSRPRNGVWYSLDPEGEGWAYTVRYGGRSRYYAGFRTKRQAMRDYYWRWKRQ